MYSLDTSLLEVKGIGSKTFSLLEQKGIRTVQDLLLLLPLHYVDRSVFGKIEDLSDEKEITFIGEVTVTSNFYRKPRSIQSATVKDETGRIKLMWFNNKFILKKLKKGEKYLISGALSKKGTLVHPQVEDSVSDSIHTGRIVPIYSSSIGIKVGSLRRIIVKILDQLDVKGPLDLSNSDDSLVSLAEVLRYLHFPEDKAQVVMGKERLALEELLVLIKRSNTIKAQWHALAEKKKNYQIKVKDRVLPQSIPFELTKAQHRVTAEIIEDLQENIPMNRLLIGDVGSGKTVVAGMAARQVVLNGYSVAFVAPTKILAEQHAQTLISLFPDVPVELIKVGAKHSLGEAKIYVGTHGVINRLESVQPGLIIYDEQHRFGVGHRSATADLQRIPNVLTMTATPIPRSLMLTIFSHLQLSTIDEMPAGRKPVETYLVSDKKRDDSYHWIRKLLLEDRTRQVIIVCPFIEPSENEAFDHVANVHDKTKELKKVFSKDFVVESLHGRMKKKEQETIVKKLFNQEIQILVTTPIVEVGVDLPTATVITIENAERFGLASLHQLRGRVGRRGQQGYCLLFSTSKSESTKERLSIFCKETNGMKLAEFDLQNRGAGDIFGMSQSGLDTLKYANWANVLLISKARSLSESLDLKKSSLLLESDSSTPEELPLAN